MEKGAWRKVGLTQATASTNWHASYGCAELVTLLRSHMRWFFFVCDTSSASVVLSTPNGDFNNVPSILGQPIVWIDQWPGETP